MCKFVSDIHGEEIPVKVSFLYKFENKETYDEETILEYLSLVKLEHNSESRSFYDLLGLVPMICRKISLDLFLFFVENVNKSKYKYELRYEIQIFLLDNLKFKLLSELYKEHQMPRGNVQDVRIEEKFRSKFESGEDYKVILNYVKELMEYTPIYKDALKSFLHYLFYEFFKKNNEKTLTKADIEFFKKFEKMLNEYSQAYEKFFEKIKKDYSS